MNAAQEIELVARIKASGKPITERFIRKQAYIFCVESKIDNKFNPVARIAGKNWLRKFLKRHLSLYQALKALKNKQKE